MNLKDGTLLRSQCYIDGQWVAADGGATRKVDNPATGETITTVPNAGAAETRRAIEAAGRAFPAGAPSRRTSARAILRRWFELMMANQDDLARLMTSEQGKPLSRVARRDRLCSLVHRMVCRGGAPYLRRHHPVAVAGCSASWLCASRSVSALPLRPGIFRPP